jgi:hypothetical protein
MEAPLQIATHPCEAALMLYLAPTEVRRLEPRHDMCARSVGTTTSTSRVGVITTEPASASATSSAAAPTTTTSSRTISEHVGRLGEQPGWRDDLTTSS